jgi:hypothetical protein
MQDKLKLKRRGSNQAGPLRIGQPPNADRTLGAMHLDLITKPWPFVNPASTEQLIKQGQCDSTKEARIFAIRSAE